jgi:CheY-like chemotaxis protein
VFGTPAAFHVLAIEDNPSDSYLLKEAFQECGANYQLIVVSKWQEAWAFLQSQPIDLLITHAGGGIEEATAFIQQLRSNPKLYDLPLVLLTGRYEAEAAYAAGVNIVLCKSVNLDVLFKQIKSLVHFWSQVAERPRSIPRKLTEPVSSEGETNQGSSPSPLPSPSQSADMLYPNPQEGPASFKNRLPQMLALRGDPMETHPVPSVKWLSAVN